MIRSKLLDQQVAVALQSQAAGRFQRLLRSRLGLWVIAAISFFESTMPVPIITDPFMVAAILAQRSRAPLVVLVTMVSSLLGGIAAFIMAAYFFDLIATYMSTDIETQFQTMVSFGVSDTFVTTITGAVTPIPYTITAWVVAVAGGSIWVFILGSLIGRTIRYAIVGYCTYQFGPAALRYARRSLTITTIAVVLLVGVYVWIKL